MTNGNGQQLDQEQSKTFEAGLAHHLQVKTELAAARVEISELHQQLKAKDVEIDGLRSLANMLESRVESCVAERDLKADRAIKLDALFSMMMATMLRFEVDPNQAELRFSNRMAQIADAAIPTLPTPRG